MSTETPETDAARIVVLQWQPDAFGPIFNETAKEAVPMDVARSLELRNAELTARIAELEKERATIRTSLDAMGDAMKTVTEQRDQWLDRFRECEKQLTEARKDGQWRPIETAPKDGTAILAKLPHLSSPVIVQFREMFNHWNVSWDGEPLSRFTAPILWMPIPSPKETL